MVILCTVYIFTILHVQYFVTYSGITFICQEDPEACDLRPPFFTTEEDPKCDDENIYWKVSRW